MEILIKTLYKTLFSQLVYEPYLATNFKQSVERAWFTRIHQISGIPVTNRPERTAQK